MDFGAPQGALFLIQAGREKLLGLLQVSQSILEQAQIMVAIFQFDKSMLFVVFSKRFCHALRLININRRILVTVNQQDWDLDFLGTSRRRVLRQHLAVFPEIANVSSPVLAVYELARMTQEAG